MSTTWEADELPVGGLCATSSYASLHKLLSSGDYSDMTIRCQGREFKTHRAIVCSQSSFFKAALGSNFKEGESGIVDLSPDDDPDSFHCFLEFLYTGTYSVGDSNQDKVLDTAKEANKHILKRLDSPLGRRSFGGRGRSQETPPPQRSTGQFRWSPYAFKPSPVPAESEKKTNRGWVMQQSVQIYVLADKYDVPALMLLARERFFEAGKDFLMCTRTWSTAPWESTDCFSIIVQMIYDNTWSAKDPLRKALQMLISMKTEDDVMNKRMREEMKANGELAVGVMDYLKEAKKI